MLLLFYYKLPKKRLEIWVWSIISPFSKEYRCMLATIRKIKIIHLLVPEWKFYITFQHNTVYNISLYFTSIDRVC